MPTGAERRNAGACSCAAHKEAVRANARLTKELSQLRKRLAQAEHRERTARQGLRQKVLETQRERDCYLQMLNEHSQSLAKNSTQERRAQLQPRLQSGESDGTIGAEKSAGEYHIWRASAQLSLRARGPATLDTTPIAALPPT